MRQWEKQPRNIFSTCYTEGYAQLWSPLLQQKFKRREYVAVMAQYRAGVISARKYIWLAYTCGGQNLSNFTQKKSVFLPLLNAVCEAILLYQRDLPCKIRYFMPKTEICVCGYEGDLVLIQRPYAASDVSAVIVASACKQRLLHMVISIVASVDKTR